MDKSTFPELTPAENAEIDRARALGWAVYYPAVPDAAAQARNTLAGARRFLAEQEQEERHAANAEAAWERAQAMMREVA